MKCPRCKEPFLLELPKELATPPQENDKPAEPVPDLNLNPPDTEKTEPAPNFDFLKKPAPSPQEPPAQGAPPPQEEEEVKLELVEDDVAVGTSAVWVPDKPILPTPAPQPPPAVTPAPASNPEVPALVEPQKATAPAPVIQPVLPEPTASATSSYRRRKKSWMPTIVVSVFLLLGVGTVGYLVTQYKPAEKTKTAANNTPQKEEDFDSPVAENEPYSRERLSYRTELVDEFVPTSGEPLHLAMMPRGVSFVIHIRPALLWSTESQYQVLKASLTSDVTDWIAAKLKEVCRRDPEQIEHAYIGFILGAGGSEPEVCTVVHLKEPAKLSELIDEFKGEYVYDITERPDLRLKRDDQYAYLIKDEKTFAIAPRLYASELEESQTQPFILSVPMENLLRETDQQQLISVLGIHRDLSVHYPKLMPESTHQFMEQFLQWMGEDVDSLSWSLHPEPYLFSELKVHPRSGSNPAVVSKRLASQFENLPETLWKEVCLRMSPQELRFRKFIGRLPAMLEAFRQATIHSTTANFVSMTTVLPAKATPNLALATLFTMNEAARTDFSTEVVVATNTSKLPETVKERLSIPVDSEFSRRPLEMALQYLAGEIEVNMFVDGDALKDAGYTKNMPQTFNLGVVPVEKSFEQIVMNYQEVGKIMVMSIDESTKTITITTEKFAKQKNLPIYEFSK